MSNETQPLEDQEHLTKEQAEKNAQQLLEHYGIKAPVGMTVTGWVDLQGNWHDSREEPAPGPINIDPDEADALLARQRFEAATRHIHGPFTFLMNQNHNALRGCQSCGATWVGSMAGQEENLRWHEVAEGDEEE